MKIKIFITFFLFTLTTLKAQNYSWSKSFGGSSPDIAYNINLDASGNVYTSGFFYSTVDFNPGIGTTNLTSNGERDIFIQKMDPSGNFLWAKSFGGINSEEANINVDNLGNVYTTGTFDGTIDFNPGAGTTNLTAAGGGDIFVQKLDALGNFVWAKSFGGSSYEMSDCIYVDTSGNIYITGYFALTLDFDPGLGITNLTSIGIGDIFVQKLDALGNFVWAKSFGGTGMDIGNLISVDASGSIYTSGQFKETADFDPGAGTNNLTSTGGNDFFVQKLDAAGNFIWAKSFGGTNDDISVSLNIDTSGNLYITGQFSGTIDFYTSTGTVNLTSNGGKDNFVLKLDSSGNVIWAKSFGGINTDYGVSNIDTSGNVFTTGYFYQTVDFDPEIGTANLTSNGNMDIFIQKLDSSGNFIWAKSFGGTNDDLGNSVYVNATENIYTTGFFSATVDFDPGTGTSNLTSNGSYDVFVQKMNLETMGLIQIGNGIQVLAYPNPSSGLVQISCVNPINNVEINLTDMQGKLVYTKKLDTIYNTQIEILSPPGIYLLSIKTANNQSVIKLIKK